jgi:hypothetical protein
MGSDPRILRASLLAPAATSLLWLAVAGFDMLTATDDSKLPAAIVPWAVFMVYLSQVLAYTISGALLFRARRLRFGWLITSVVSLPLLYGTWVIVGIIYIRQELNDALVFSLFGAAYLLTALVTTVLWWSVAFPRFRKARHA